MRRAAALALAALAVAACEDRRMAEQDKILPLAPGRAGVSGARPPPEGSIARGTLAPASVDLGDPAVIARGGERFAIFCAPCHGSEGDARGIVPTIPTPPSLFAPDLSGQDAEDLVAVITDGVGAMYPQAGQVPLPDRWAIAAWIKDRQRRRGGD